jgi:PIN domain nuclease of toxin-antitoxin system
VTPPVLDTHAWLWWIARDSRLGAAMLAALDGLPADGRPYLSDISLWEVATLVAYKRISLAVPLAEWLAAAAHPRNVRLVATTPSIAADVAVLPATFHRDPADRLIVSTCRVMGLPLLTSDRRILQSRLVPRWKPSA